MIKKLWRHHAYRCFSRSNSIRNQPTKTTKPNDSTKDSFSGGLEPKGAPKEWEKKVLVWTKRYKSLEEVPTLVSYDTMSKAKSMMRIRVANYMIVVVLVLCFIYSYRGKQLAKGGDSITKRVLDNKKLLKAERRLELETEAKAKAQTQAQTLAQTPTQV